MAPRARSHDRIATRFAQSLYGRSHHGRRNHARRAVAYRTRFRQTSLPGSTRERARQFQHLLDTLKITQEALAKRYKVSQGEISNSIRLLRLPEVAQKAVISGEITATEARDALVPWVDMPEVIGEAVRHNRDNLNSGVNQAAQKRARSMSDASDHEKPRLFKPTPEQRKELRLRRIWGEDYAFNVELYDRLQTEAAAKVSKRAEKREAAEERAGERETSGRATGKGQGSGRDFRQAALSLEDRLAAWARRRANS
jgi:hypothetical protein